MKVFIAHSSRDRELVGSVVALLRESGHDALRPDDVTAGEQALSEISAAIRSSDVVVAMVSGSNSNVFYELGLATGAGIPTLLAAFPGEPPPSVLSSVPYVQLSGDRFRDAQAIARRLNELQTPSPAKLPTFPSAEAALRAASLNPATLEALAPTEFERLVAEFFRERGFVVSQNDAPRDAGVDLVIRSPKDEQDVFVEVKKLTKQGRVSVEAVRSLLGAVSAAAGSLGVLVTTSGYTAAAAALAAGTPIVLRTLEQILAAKSKDDLIQS